jgi:hypothetical protein
MDALRLPVTNRHAMAHSLSQQLTGSTLSKRLKYLVLIVSCDTIYSAVPHCFPPMIHHRGGIRGAKKGE